MQNRNLMDLFNKTVLGLFVMLSINGYTQKAYIGGTENLPVIDANSHELLNTIYGFSSQLRWLQSSSDHSTIYGGTVFYQPVLNLYKIDAATDEIIIQKPVQWTVLDLEISDDDQFLFHHNGTSVFRVDANTLETVDSVYTGKVLVYIEYFDNNTIYAASTERIYKLDYLTHSITDSIVLGTFQNPAEMELNANKTKLFIYKSSTPLTLWVADLATMTIENTISLSGMIGSSGDLALSPDGNYLYVTSTGSTTINGSIRVLNTSDMTTVADIEKDDGSGVMSFSPEGDLWIPNNISKSITIIDTENFTIKDVISTDPYSGGPFNVAFGSSVTGLTEDAAYPSIVIAPNPVTNYLYLRNADVENQTKFSVFNLQMQVLFEAYIYVSDFDYDMSEYPAGVYVVVVESAKHKEVRKIIKK